MEDEEARIEEKPLHVEPSNEVFGFSEVPYDYSEELSWPEVSEDFKKVAGAAAIAAVLATTLATTPIHIDQAALLPEPTPIVQVIDMNPPDQAPQTDDQEQQKAKINILKILKYLVIALLVVAAVVFGAIKGCAACTGQAIAPIVQDDDSSQQQTTDAGRS